MEIHFDFTPSRPTQEELDKKASARRSAADRLAIFFLAIAGIASLFFTEKLSAFIVISGFMGTLSYILFAFSGGDERDIGVFSLLKVEDDKSCGLIGLGIHAFMLACTASFYVPAYYAVSQGIAIIGITSEVLKAIILSGLIIMFVSTAMGILVGGVRHIRCLLMTLEHKEKTGEWDYLLQYRRVKADAYWASVSRHNAIDEFFNR